MVTFYLCILSQEKFRTKDALGVGRKPNFIFWCCSSLHNKHKILSSPNNWDLIRICHLPGDKDAAQELITHTFNIVESHRD